MIHNYNNWINESDNIKSIVENMKSIPFEDTYLEKNLVSNIKGYIEKIITSWEMY